MSVNPQIATDTRARADFLIIRLRGSQADMGAQHGRMLRDLGGWEPAVDYYPEMAHRLLADGDDKAVHGRVLKRFGKGLLYQMMKRIEADRPKEYLERTFAFGEALGLPMDQSPYMMVMDVFQNTIGVVGRWGIGPFKRRAGTAAVAACTSVMVWGDRSSDGNLMHARNFDFPGVGVWDLSPQVVFCEPDDGLNYGFVSTRGVDTPGVTAFNEAGITVSMHTRFHRDVRFSGAAVVDLGHDIARRAETLADAVRIVRERPVASTWGIAVSSARENRAITIETSGKQVAVVTPPEGQQWLAATNRNRHPLMIPGQVASGPGWAEHSDGRERRAQQVIQRHGSLSVTDLQRLMGDHVEADDPARERATGSVISQPITVKTIICEPQKQQLRVSVGHAPTAWGPYEPIKLEWGGEVGWTRPAPIQVPPDASIAELKAGMRFRSGPAGDAYARFLKAVQLESTTHDWDAILGHLEAAAELDPTEPTYRFLAAALRMRGGHYAKAVAHVEAGLSNEDAPFRRAQLLLWGSRAAHAAGEKERAQAMRDELQLLDHPNITEHHLQAQAEARRPYKKAKLGKIGINMLIADVL